MRRILFLVSFAIFALSALPCVADSPADRPSHNFQVAGIDDPASVTVFLRTLKTAVAHNDRKKVASLIDFPIIARVHGKSEHVKSASQFVRWYPQIFNPHVKKAVAAQQAKDLFVNWRGVMIGDGEIWFGPAVKGGRLQIFAVNN